MVVVWDDLGSSVVVGGGVVVLRGWSSCGMIWDHLRRLRISSGVSSSLRFHCSSESSSSFRVFRVLVEYEFVVRGFIVLGFAIFGFHGEDAAMWRRRFVCPALVKHFLTRAPPFDAQVARQIMLAVRDVFRTFCSPSPQCCPQASGGVRLPPSSCNLLRPRARRRQQILGHGQSRHIVRDRPRGPTTFFIQRSLDRVGGQCRYR